MQGDIWAGGNDEGRVRTALGHRSTHAAGAGAYRALLEIVGEIVDAIAVVGVGAVERDGGGEGGGR